MNVTWRQALAVAAGTVLACAQSAAQEDPYLWLEEIESPEVLDWVRAENARSLAVLEADPRFEPMRREALAILTSDARIPFGEIHAGFVYNFWQDETRVRGVWRRAGLESYLSGAPDWQILIDYDALAEEEGENWVAGDVVCLEPEYRRCMVEVSDGGKDASVWKEFDVATGSFVEGGFDLPEAKTDLAWLDADALLVATDLGAGSLTDSGYARTLVRLERGEPLEAAPRVFEGARTDVGVFARVERDGDTAHVFVQRAVSFFETEYYYSVGRSDERTRLPVPLHSDLYGVLDGRALFFLREPWRHRDAGHAEGTLVAYDLETGAVETVFAAAENRAFQGVGIGESELIVQYLEDVSGFAARVSRDERGRWNATPLSLPAHGVVKIVSAGGGTDAAMLSFESLTAPNALYYAGPGGELRKIAEAPAFYDASDVVVEQRFATSKDGTRIPYFLAARKDVLEAGDAPTVQYGYGGFLNAVLPVYYEEPARPQHGALAGKLWISRGGVLVLANIRGGSEYGPAWHRAALKENRQRAFDDFIAVSEALIESGVTGPDKLGAIGRSNGGLLMGAILTQRPELYAAIDCGVPLLDMRRYTKLGAGASWIGEYGDPDDPSDWAYISQYSPYQRLRADEPYPKVLFYTSTQDDRVHPAHARKAAARMQALGYDYFYYENIEGGHGGTTNQEQLAYRTALEYAYFAHLLMPAEGR